MICCLLPSLSRTSSTYICFIIKEHGVGNEKCHQVAQACSFYYKHVYPCAFIVPSAFYPRKSHKLPQVFSVEQIKQLLAVITNEKHKMVVSLFYGSGLRMNELKHLKLCDIQSTHYQIKVVEAKGGKQRMTLLPKHLLEPLRCYYKSYRPKMYNNWVAAKRSNDKFLFPVAAMKKVYKGIFLKTLRQILIKGLLKTQGLDVEKTIKKAGYKNWNIYAKSPFGSVASVIEYLGRYTHKTAITKHRIASITQHSVTFNYKDYTDGSRQKQMTLSIVEFLRRFELHFLPRGFVKIRHYGFLHNHGKTTRLNAVRKNMELQPLPPIVNIPVAQRMLEQYGKDISLCPKCHKGTLVLVAIVYPKALPVSLGNHIGSIEQPRLNNKASP